MFYVVPQQECAVLVVSYYHRHFLKFSLELLFCPTANFGLLLKGEPH